MNKSKKIDFLVLFLLVIVAIVITLVGHVRFLTSSFLFLAVPSIYLVIRKTQNLKLILPSVLFIGVLLGFILDFVATFNNAWFIPQGQLIFPYRILGAAPVDELICLVFWVFLILLVYEHFFEKKRVEHLQLKRYLCVDFIPACIVVALIVCAFFTKPQLITFPYAYAVLGVLTAMPLFWCGFKKPKLLKKVLYVLPYFIFLFLSFELTALYLGQWIFPGQYVGQVEIFSLRFPYEELLVWIVASSVIVIIDYKLFVDIEE